VSFVTVVPRNQSRRKDGSRTSSGDATRDSIQGSTPFSRCLAGIVDEVFTISLTVVDDDPEQIDDLTRQLAQELRATEADRVELIHAPVPEGARSSAGTVASIVVAVASSPVLVSLAGVLREWVSRRNKRRMVIRDGDRSIEVTGYDVQEIAGFLGKCQPQVQPELEPGAPDEPA
jgi:hypothetical protein